MASCNITKSSNRAITNEIEADDDEDIISSLPDVLLIHILSLIGDTKEAVKTCVLSKRWEFVWTDLLEITLNGSIIKDDQKLDRFVVSVGRVLSMCRSLNKFAVKCLYTKCFASNINRWIYLAIENKVRDITLEFDNITESVYELPQMLYSFSSLSKLYVRNCVMAPLGIIGWESLERLIIGKVELSDSVMENILSNSPLLKRLQLDSFWGLNYLNIHSPNLTELKILYPPYKVTNTLAISAPYLRVLQISWHSPERKFRLTNVSSVVEATIYLYDCFASEMIKMNYMKQLLESLQSVEILELGPYSLDEIVTTLEGMSWKVPSFNKLLSLTISVFSHERSIPGILALLRSSTNLRTLSIKPRYSTYEKKLRLDEYERYVKDCNTDLFASHLKTVEINDFTETEDMLTLIQILLKYTKVLEKMIIKVNGPSSGATSIDSMELAKRLCTFPKASPKAVISVT